MSQRRAIRNEIMLQLYGYRGAAAGGGRSADRIARACRREGQLPDVTPAEITQECAYLGGKLLLREQRDELARDEVTYIITAEGVDYTEEHLL